MPHWREDLEEIASGVTAITSPVGFREVLVDAVQEFGQELRKHGRTVSIEAGKERIGISMRTDEGLEFEATITFEDVIRFTLFSNEAIISNFRFSPKTFADERGCAPLFDVFVRRGADHSKNSPAFS